MSEASSLPFFAELAELARSLGHTHRLQLLDLIAQNEHSVERLAELAGLSLANASQHLQHLKRAGFVTTRRDGKRIFYRLSDGPIAPLLAALKAQAEFNHKQLATFIADSRSRPDRLEAIDAEELLRRMREDSVTLLDVRAETEYAVGHVPGAVNIPLPELARRLAELRKDQEVIAYCRGSHCALSAEAVRALSALGYKARHFDSGLPGWQALGLAISSLQSSGSKAGL
ncbi:ArsR/SmtB family transcription factor [Aestuariivirga sp. YIM B02566]|uniref:Metalloregulator ArsR/SmtB family transcription factor n=1 Tax=Taklimakanibacter albus TaxID=2800327 RepID=A0ACC5QZW5_9HYPH|nr:metalloregulator ArsR/SmtB family transcription factor [Aestuariivirga sp. YIM B02566]MBK1865905.1 metalloregulator ArsR/SmtB family transcription factor [Aestuariivirga sp. YIM B02566]